MYLNCHSWFSLRYGTISPEDLVALAAANGVEALALTDIHNTSAAYDFVKACRAAGIHPVVGVEFRRGDELLYIALAQNLEGFAEINAFFSQYNHQGADFPELPPHWSQVYVIYPWARRDRVTLSEHEFLGIRPSELPLLFRSRFRYRSDKLVALATVSFRDKAGFNTHRLLRAVDHNVLLSRLAPTSQACQADETFLPPEALRQAFAEHPDLLRNAQALLARCSFGFEFGHNHSRQTFTGGKYEDMMLLEKLARDGMELRYGLRHKEAQRRLERELRIIDQLDFNAYFLITWDFVQYGRARGFFHVGRGSGANSITAYCLGLTDVDPIELDLYFERFLNPKRTSPPDFDIDYSWKDRDAVIDYVFKRYRSSHTSLIATYNTFKGRAVIRELGKVFGLPPREIDRMVQDRHHEPQDELGRLTRLYGERIQGFPNHLGIHAGGILISETPIHHFTATTMPPKGFPITHFDMYVAEDVGLHKFDVLSQRGLGHIRESIDLVRRYHQRAVDIHRVEEFKQDPKIRELLASGRTVGCFYVESPAMRMLLKRLKCENYLTLVAASSIIRPGVSSSGMMRAYIERHNGRPFTFLHPKLHELLHDTYGVMVYQEDVIKVAHLFAGLDLADADLLRRAMSGKFRSRKEFDEIHDKFFQSCAAQGYPPEMVQELWRQIESFAGYSFSKAHSASFAVESYQSLYLKAYHPLEFITAVINNFGGFYDTEIYLHEARMLGAQVQAPCVNRSDYFTSLAGTDLYLGFVHLKSLEEALGKRIEWERRQNGPFADLADFARRMQVAEEQLTILIRAGALRFTGKTKAQLLWDAQIHHRRGGVPRQSEALFAVDAHFELPPLPDDPLTDAYDQLELLGFPLVSPFSLIPPLPDDLIRAAELGQHIGKVVRIAGYLVCTKEVKTVRNERMQFANLIDPAGDTFDITVFPPEVKQYPFTGRGVYVVEGKVVEEFGLVTLDAVKMGRVVFRSVGV